MNQLSYRVLLVPIGLLVLPSAGCMSHPEPEPPAAATSVGVVTNPCAYPYRDNDTTADRSNARDSWGTATKRTLYDASGPLYEFFGLGSQLRPDNQPAGFPALNGTVPNETATVDVGFAYNSTAPGGFGYHVLMSWHGADTSNEGPYSAPNQTQKGGNSEVDAWRVAVAPRMWDSPHANTTRWQIAMSYDGQPGSNGHGGASNAYVDGDYHLWVVISRASSAVSSAGCAR